MKLSKSTTAWILSVPALVVLIAGFIYLPYYSVILLAIVLDDPNAFVDESTESIWATGLLLMVVVFCLLWLFLPLVKGVIEKFIK